MRQTADVPAVAEMHETTLTRAVAQSLWRRLVLVLGLIAAIAFAIRAAIVLVQAKFSPFEIYFVAADSVLRARTEPGAGPRFQSGWDADGLCRPGLSGLPCLAPGDRPRPARNRNRPSVPWRRDRLGGRARPRRRRHARGGRRVSLMRALYNQHLILLMPQVVGCVHEAIMVR